MQVNYDGKEIASLQQDFAMEGQNVYSHSVSKDASGRWRRMTPCWTGCARSSI